MRIRKRLSKGAIFALNIMLYFTWMIILPLQRGMIRILCDELGTRPLHFGGRTFLFLLISRESGRWLR